MAVPFATRPPFDNEVEKLRYFLSVFRDGTGSEREIDGSTRPGWRQIERCFAELLTGHGGENKAIFDVVAPDPDCITTAYGFSIKSKKHSLLKFAALQDGGRAYMEIANSPSKFWGEIFLRTGLREDAYRNQLGAQAIGMAVIDLIERWHIEGKSQFESKNPGINLDLDLSCYLCLSYSDTHPSQRMYQIHAFPLRYPRGIVWRYTSQACLSGYDPRFPDQILLDLYGLSGGQLKYYPKTDLARFSSPPFQLENIAPITLSQKARLLFPDAF